MGGQPVVAVEQVRAAGKESEAIGTLGQSRPSVKTMFEEAGLPVLPTTTHIVPLMVGDPVRAKRISDILLAEYGVYVQPINYPTVPRGTERLRFTPSPVHDSQQIDHLVRAMDALWSRCALNRAHAVA